MTSKSTPPSSEADIDQLHAWAARANKAAPGDAAAPEGTRTTQPGPSAAANAMTFLNNTADRRSDRERDASPSMRGGSLLPKVLLVIGAGLAAYLVFSFIMGLLMTLLMIVGGVALLYAVFRIGRSLGRRDG